VALWTLALLCAASEIVLLFEDRTYAAIAVGFAVYLGLVLFAVVRLVPAPPPNDDVLIARGTRGRLAWRAAIVAASFVVMFLHSFFFAGWNALPPVHVFYRWLALLPPHLGSAFPNFVLFALIPGVLVVLLGARPRELGLTRPARGTLVAGTLAVGLFVLSWIVRIAQGYPVARLGMALLHNLLSNGFTEEFWTRGLVFSHLRAYARTEWALVLQALVFALMHLGGSLHDEPNLLGVFANIIALNAPMGYVLALIAMRTRSLALPVAIHLALDTERNVFA
jgi:membrane protease YdiL (CAAX protease family)